MQHLHFILIYFSEIVVSAHVGGLLSPLELVLLVFDWLMGMCLFVKCCELVNEPWICA